MTNVKIANIKREDWQHHLCRHQGLLETFRFLRFFM